MESENDIPASQAPAVLAEIQQQAAAVAPADPTPEEREQRERDREEATRRYVIEARRADNARRWELHCPPALQESDWAHASLAPFRACVDRVLGYQVGPKGILASGPTGRGKTRSMWQLMRRLGVDEGHDVRFWSASDWFTTLQDQIRFGRDEARGWVETVARRKIVFIDDLGQEGVTLAKADWAQAWFFRFLDIRVGERLPLFVTTNLSAHGMADRANGRNGSVRGDPLVRRLLDLCDPVSFETEQERRDRAELERKAQR